MKIAVIGAGGRVGRRTVEEALSRGHQVTAVVRDPKSFDLTHDRATVKAADVTDADSVAEAVAGHDAVISTVGPPYGGGDMELLVKAARSLLAGLPQAGVRRLVV